MIKLNTNDKIRFCLLNCYSFSCALFIISVYFLRDKYSNWTTLLVITTVRGPKVILHANGPRGKFQMVSLKVSFSFSDKRRERARRKKNFIGTAALVKADENSTFITFNYSTVCFSWYLRTQKETEWEKLI